LTTSVDEVRAALRLHVERLAATPRNVDHYRALLRAERYIAERLTRAGYTAVAQEYDAAGFRVANVEAERRGSMQPGRLIVIGAHYDSIGLSPGANDNASGVAAMLELARLHASAPQAAATVRFVAFVNEEPPYFMTDGMGSLVYARRMASRGERAAAMISLETIGYYSDERGSQRYPAPFDRVLPDRGNFIAMVSNFASVRLLVTTAWAFRRASSLRVIASPAPESIPGVGWSDHWSFWQQGCAAMMVTDTAPYRYPHYHAQSDTPDKLDYERMSRVVIGISAAIRALM
jgi:Zn-dependent M28 family amino/carboxypeptidase